MKIFKYTIYALTYALALLALSSCSDDKEDYAQNDKGATPKVSYIKECLTEPNDEHIERAYPGTMVCISGEHLGDVQQVWFNDQQSRLNPNFVTSTNIICSIPTTFPSEVTNQIRLVTSTGKEVLVPFEVIIPGPTLKTMSLEYAPAGSQVSLSGDYFMEGMKVTFWEGVEAEVIKITQTEAVIIVPEGAQNGPVTVETPFGSSTSTFHYMDQRGLLFEFDGVTSLGNHGWHNAVIETDENAISGNYMRLGDPSVTLAGVGAWDESHFAFEYWCGDDQSPMGYPTEGRKLTDLADFSQWKDMSLKFEMCIPATNPWQSCAMQIIFAGTDLVTYGWSGTDVDGKTVATANNQFYQDGANPGYPRLLYRPWTQDKAFDTAGQWITVTLPLSNACYDLNGGNATQGLTPESFASMTIFVVGGGFNGVDCNPVIKIDNIRVIPNK